MKKTLKRPLPKSVFFKNGAYYFVHRSPVTKKNEWVRLGNPWSIAYEKYLRVVPQLKGDKYIQRRIIAYQTGDIPEPHIAAMLKQSRSNAKARDIEHAISIDALRDLAARSGGHCALTGIKFEYGVAKEVEGLSTRRKRPWAPSIDRIDSSRGYHIDNIRLVCVAVNIARQDFPDEILFKMARGLSNMDNASEIK